MSPVNIMYIILGVTAVLLFIIFKYVKGSDHEPTVDLTERLSNRDEKKPFVDYRELKFSSDNQKITLEEFDEFVAKYKLDLPELYKKIMLATNGGRSYREYYKGSDAEFEPIKYGEYTINQTLELADFFLEERFFPFIDNGEYGYCISMNEDSLHQVFQWDETGDFRFECESLQDFLNELDESDDF